MHRRSRVALASSLVLASCNGFGCPQLLYSRVDRPPVLPKLEPLPQIGSLSAERCGQCHKEIYTEWNRSLMAQSTVNPFFRRERAERNNLFLCGRCHHPLQNQEEEIVESLRSIDPLMAKARANVDYDPQLAEEGVTCAVCHMSPEALFFPDDPPPVHRAHGGEHGTMYNARSLNDAVSPHPLAVGPGLAEPGRVCVRCHQFDPIGSHLERPPLDTVAEYEEYRSGGGPETCTGCHMPEVKRSAVADAPIRTGHQHSFLGVRDADFVRRFLALEARIEGGGTKVVVAIENKAGHRVPTGEPARVLEVSAQLMQGERMLGHRRVRIARDFDTVALRERRDDALRVRERRRVELHFTPAEIAAAEKVRVSIDLARYEEDHPLVEALAGTGLPQLRVHIFDAWIRLVGSGAKTATAAHSQADRPP
jgi:hypothetical protein